MRRRRRDAGLVRLGERDLFALRVVGEQYVVRLSLLADILTVFEGAPVSADAARKVAGRWHRARLAEVAPILAGEGSHVWLTSYGLAQVGLEYRPWSPSAVAEQRPGRRRGLDVLPRPARATRGCRDRRDGTRRLELGDRVRVHTEDCDSPAARCVQRRLWRTAADGRIRPSTGAAPVSTAFCTGIEPARRGDLDPRRPTVGLRSVGQPWGSGAARGVERFLWA